MSRSLIDSDGRSVSLGPELGRGGEGSVYELIGSRDIVAKVYHEQPDANKSAKLLAMARDASPSLARISAWPTSTLHELVGGAPVGLLMPRVSGAEVHRVYSPAHRKIEFPSYSWEQLIIIAHNVAAAVQTIHDAGHVVGDVNQGNVLVGQSGTVHLIDCDSFQIRDRSTWRLCDVGVAHFTPPELQGGSFRGVERTQNHDAFGLAVLIFHLLFMGRHPFAGRFSGRGDMPIEQAIVEHRFAFGRGAAAVQMAPPPNALSLASASGSVAEHFERAFGRLGTQPEGRPSASQWASLLRTLREELVSCGVNRTHRFHRSLNAACPWCAIERSGGPDFFSTALAVYHAAASGFDLQAVWSRVLAVPGPEGSLTLPVASGGTRVQTQPVSLQRRLGWKAHRALLFACAVAAIGTCQGGGVADRSRLAVILLGIASFALRHASGLVDERQNRLKAVAATRAALASVEERWKTEASLGTRKFAARLSELHSLRVEYLNLDTSKQQDRKTLESSRKERQLQRHLERHYIDRAPLQGIGAGLRSTLASYGIETAADVERSRVLGVPGFGPARLSVLLYWRKQVESGFQFDPKLGVDPADVAAIDAKYARRRLEIERALLAGPDEMRRLSSVGQQERERLIAELRARREAAASAEANLKAAS